MVNVCCARNCRNYRGGGQKVSTDKAIRFFSVPSDPARQAIWLKNIGRADLLTQDPKKNHLKRVCSKHFDKNSYAASFLPNYNYRLKFDAVPTIFEENSDEDLDLAESSSFKKQVRTSNYNDDLEEDDPNFIIYKCAYCGVKYEEREKLIAHVPIHKKTGIPCNVCDIRFETTNEYHEHLMTHEEVEHQCPHCDETFLYKALLTKHLSWHINQLQFFCEFCKSSFGSKKELEDHNQTHASVNFYICEKCGQCFRAKETLKRHKMNHIDGNVECKMCDMNFINWSLLEKHQEVKTTTTYVCKTCGEQFDQQCGLMQHKKGHIIEKISCNKCILFFPHKYDLDKHKLVHKPTGPKICSTCKIEFKNLEMFLHHLQVHIKESFYAKSIFNQCIDGDDSIKMMEKELAIHKCVICKRTFTNDISFRYHMVKNHQRDKLYTCYICCEEFTQKTYMNYHQAEVHQIKIKIECTLCNEELLDLDELGDHLKKTHRVKGSFCCDGCDEEYNDVNSLRTHDQLHKGKYACGICNHVFYQQDDLLEHVFDSKHLLFHCSKCSISFDQNFKVKNTE